MRELKLDLLRTFVAVSDLGSFIAASRALHLAPPTVTLHVADLESHLGAKLLLRGKSRVTLTTVGAALLERARRLLGDVDETLAAIRLHAQGHAGTVRVGASTGAIAHLLSQALLAISKERPAIDVQAMVLTSEATMARLSAGTLDIGMVALPQAAIAGVQIRAWRRDPVMAFLPATWARPSRITPAWLASRPLILNDGTTRLSRLTSEWFAAAGHRPRARIELNYNDAIKSLVAAGYGAALLPHEATASAPDPRIAMVGLRPVLWRPLGLAHRIGGDDGATGQMLRVLWELRSHA